MLMAFSVGNVWATLPASPTWEAQALADIADGSTIIIISNSTTATNIALPAAGAGTSNPPKKACTVTTNAGVTTITPPDGTTLQDLAWTVSKQTSSWKFYVEGSTTNCLYLTGTSSNTALRVGNGSSNNEFVMGDAGKLLKVTTAARFVGPNDNGGTDWRTYNTENATNYKGAQLTFYVLKAASSCSNTVTITKGAETNGTYTLSATEICGDGEGEDVTISDITPASGYAFDEITTSASGTVDNEKKKVTGITANTTITVLFKELQKYTVSFNTGAGNPTVSPITEATAGAGITLPAGPTPACSADGWTFAGWAAAAVGEETTTAPTLLSGNYNPTDNVTLYAVYKRTEEGGGVAFARYEKVTANPDDWSGTYLLAANTSGTTYYTFTGQNGSNSYGSSTEHTPGTTEKTEWEVVVAKTTNGYSMYHTNGGKYLGLTGSGNNLNFNETYSASKYDWTLSYDGGAQSYAYNTRYIECNTSSSYRVACYTASQKRFYLYKRIEEAASTTYYLSAPSCCTKHNIELVLGVQHGSISADLTSACEGTEVTLTATPDTHCNFVAWDVKQGETPVAVSDNKFTMPDGDVTVSATFAEIKNAVTFAAPAGGTLSIMNGEDAVATGAQIVEGTALTVTATPDAENHYIGGAIKVVKTSDESDVTASVLKGSTLTMPNYAITVSATFTPTYAINIVAEGGSIALEYVKGGAADGYAIAGTTISAEATADDAHVFASLTVSENVTEPTIVESLAEFVMPAEAVTITATFDAKSTPTISVSTDAIAFDPVDYNGELAAQTFKVSGVALVAGKLTITSNNEAFSVSPAEIDVDGALDETEITVTPKTTACGTFNATITINGGTAAAKEVSVSLTVNKLASNLAWSAAEATVTIDANDNVFPTLTNPRNLPVVYSSLYDEVASIDENGAVTLKKAGETMIIVNFAGNDTVTALAEDDLYYTLTVQQTYTAKWFVNGEELTESTQTAVAGTDLIVPTNPTKLADDCDDMVFKGWAEAAIVSKQDDAPTYTTKTKMPEANVNFYAVFASEVPGAPVQKVDNIDNAFIGVSGTSYVAWTDKVGVSGAVYAGSSAGGNDAVQLRSNKNADGLVVTSTGAGKVTNVTVAWNTNTAATRTIDIYGKNTPYSAASDLYGENAGTLLGSINIDNATSLDVTGDYTYIGIRSNNGALYLDNIAVKWIVPGETTYTNYMTTCPSCPKVNLLKAATEHGSYTFQQSGIAVSSVKTCEAATVDVVFEPAEGYELANFQISELDGVSYADGVITIAQNAAGNLTTTATFAPKNYSVTMTQTGDADATLSEDQTNKHMGDEITVTAGEKAGYYFLGWAADVEVAFADAKAYETTFPMPASNVKVTAKYAKILSVAEALALIPNEDDTYNNAVVEAYVAIVKNYSDTYKSIDYYIQDLDENGFGTHETLMLVYGGKGMNGTEFSSMDDIKKNAKVIIFGQLKNFKGTKEFSTNSYLLLYEEAEYEGLRIYGEATNTEYEVGDAFSFAGLKAKHVYSNGYAVSQDPTWNADPYYIAATTTVVSVTATNGTVVSPAVNVPVTVKTHKVTITTPENGTLVVKNGEETIASGDAFTKGTILTVEATPVDANYALTALTAGETVILAAKQFEVGTSDIEVVATFAEKEAAPISWSAVAATAYTVGKSYTLPTLTNELGLAVTYSSETPATATISNDEDHEGEISVEADGTTVITATYNATAEGAYKTTAVSYTLTVYAPATVVVTGDATKKEYFYNETFSFEGLGAKATYADETEYVIPAEEITWAPAEAPVITADANIEVKATWQGITSEVKNIAVTKKLRQLDYADLYWSSYDRENILLGYSETPAVRSVINKYNLPVTYRSGNGSVMSVNAETGVITAKAPGFASMFVEFAGNEEYASHNASYPVYVFGYDHIELSGEATKTAYEAGEKFSFEGLTATAVYTLSNQDPKQVNVTDEATWNASPEYVTADGDIAVTATWQEKTNEPVNVAVTVNKHKVTITAPENGTLVVKNGEEAIASGDEFAKGTLLTIKATPASDEYKAGVVTVTGATLDGNTFTVGTSDITVSATFAEKAVPAAEEFSWSTTAYTAYIGDELNIYPALTNALSLTVSYTSSNTEVATIDAEGQITILAEGETTISATSAMTADFKAQTVSYTLTVAQSTGQDTIYSYYGKGQKEAIEFGGTAKAEGGDAGIVVGTAQRGNYTIKLGKGFNNANFVGITLNKALKAGDKIAVASFITSSGKTAEFGMDFSADAASASTDVQKTFNVTQLLTESGEPNDTIIPVPEAADGAKYIRIYRNVGNTSIFVANFTIIRNGGEPTPTYAVTIEEPANGTLAINGITSGEKLEEGTNLKVVTAADQGYMLEAVKVVNTETTEDVTALVLNGTTLTVPDFAITVSATFVEVVEPTDSWAEIVFTEVANAGTWTDSVFHAPYSNFALKATTPTGKLSIDNNVATFGTEEEHTSYSYRFKTNGITSINNVVLALNIPVDGTLRFAVRTASNTATDRALVVIQNNDTILNYTVIESESKVDGYYRYIYVQVKAGTAYVETTSETTGGLNFYAFGFQAAKPTYSVSMAETTNGTLAVKYNDETITSGDQFIAGTVLTVVTTPSENYELDAITVKDLLDADVTEVVLNGTTLTVPDYAIVVSATFKAKGSGTALDNTEADTKAVKTMENGVLIIRRGDKTYNGQGQLLR